jgi:hypothetical protein
MCITLVQILNPFQPKWLKSLRHCKDHFLCAKAALHNSYALQLLRNQLSNRGHMRTKSKYSNFVLTFSKLFLCTLFSSAVMVFLGNQAFAQQGRFFSKLDTSRDFMQLTVEQKKLDQYLRLSAKLSIYAFYCDPSNKLAYSQNVYDWSQQQLDINAQVELHFGKKISYNRYEQMRNEESLIFSQNPALCVDNFGHFKQIISAPDSAAKYRVSKP